MTEADAPRARILPLVSKVVNASGGTLFLVVLLIFLFLTISKEQFFAYSNLYSLGYDLSIDAIAIAGFTYVMVMGEIDLSVGSVYALAGTLTGWLLKKAGMDLYPAIGISLLAATSVGFFNGILVARLKVNSLMLTIGTLILVQGLVGVLASDLVGGTYPRFFRMLARERWWGINTTVYFAVIGLAVLMFLQARSGLFRKIYLVGENPESAQVYGIRSDRLKLGAFVASALLAGIAGVYTSSRLTHASTDMGVGLEFTFVTAAILGGASLYGGRGSVRGSVLGLLFLALIFNAFVLYNVNAFAQPVVVGVLLIGAVLIDMLTKSNRAS
ncbi:MAG: ABC transporter permease [bacterium]|nr:ABC transporter permease [bacterium]